MSMSLLDEFEEEVAKRNILERKRSQIRALRKQAKEAFDAQFLLGGDASHEMLAKLQGRIEAYDECLQVLADEKSAEKEHPPKKRDLFL